MIREFLTTQSSRAYCTTAPASATAGRDIEP